MQRWLILSLVLIAALIGYVAFSYSPCTWDAMTYHLPRIMHWLQNGGTTSYTTSNLRQLSYCPFAEYLMAGTFIVFGNDRFVNFVQFFAMLGSWFVAYLLSGLLGATRLVQWLSVVLVACIPMGILQGSSTQTDYVATFFLTGFVYLLMRGSSILTGVALGLALLTKAYCYVYALPFLLVFKPKSWKVILGIAFLLNLNYFVNNYLLFNSPFGYTAGVEFGNPLTNFFHNVITSLTVSLDEDHAGYPQYVVLGLTAIFLWLWHNRMYRKLNKYFYSIFLAVFLFFIMVKWNQFVCRFHLPIIVLMCPFIAVVIQGFDKKKLVIICALLFALALPYVLIGHPRSLLGEHKSREEQYFVKRPELYNKYKAIVKDIKASGCKDIGITGGSDVWEYPLWAMLGKGYRIEHRNVNNISNTLPYPLGEFKTCYEVKL